MLLAMSLSDVQSMRIFRLIFSRVSIFERTPFPLKHYRELTRPGHFALSLLMEYLVTHSSCSMVMIGYIVADEVPKPKDREHGA